jgi:hypothetical protein
VATETGNIVTRKIGPLPGYAWIAFGVAGLVVYLGRKSAASSGGGTSSANSATPNAVNYASQTPQMPYSYEQSNSDQALASLVSALAYQVQQTGGSVSPGNTGGPSTSPGSTGNPGVQPTPAPAPSSAAASLPPINSADYPIIGTPGTSYVPLGQISAPGGMFTGENVGGGAPVYAFMGGQYQQDFNSATLPVGTVLATPSNFSQYIAPGTVTEKV